MVSRPSRLRSFRSAEIVDTAGNDDFGVMLENWISRGNGFLLVYAINDPDSYQKVSKKRDRILKIKERPNIPIILVGNKCDLEKDRKVTYEEGQALAAEWGATFMETSAKEKINVEEIFIELTRKLRKEENEREKPHRPIKKKKRWCSIL